MKKKIISIVFTVRRSTVLLHNLKRDLTAVFGDTLDIRLIYSDLLMPNQMVEGDAILLMRPSVMPLMKQHVADPRRLIIVTRTVSEDSIYRIYDIPKGTNVLVVNDSPETANETVAMLYQLGITHLNLIPYLGAQTDLTEITTAITPGEAHLVPLSISNIVDIGDRRLDIQTFLDIFPLLDISSDEVKKALIHYTDGNVELRNGVKKRYIYSYTLNETLKQIINLQSSGVIVTDPEYKVSFWNPMVERMFDRAPSLHQPLALCLPDELLHKLTAPDFTTDLLLSGQRQLMATRTPLSAMGQASGYCFTFESAAQIRNSGSELSRKLKKQGLTARYTFDDILHTSDVMRHAIFNAQKVAATDYTVLVTGQTGTGKEMFAQAIHNFSPRKNEPFVAVNCAALPESLLESELFGYEEGAFTGARRGGRIGLFEQANGGTIFLDEIGDMPYLLQSKLLRVLQEQQIVRLGGNTVIDINVRIITATNCDLCEMIQQKQFREDLYYRLNVFPIYLPALCERKEDILLIFQHLSQLSRQALPEDICAQLTAYAWPGNIRELRNAAEYYKLMGTLECIRQMPASAVVNAVPSNVATDLPHQILQILMALSLRGEGAGRGSLLTELRRSGQTVSENRLEAALRALLAAGLIERGRGRSGVRLTEHGRAELAGSESNLSEHKLIEF